MVVLLYFALDVDFVHIKFAILNNEWQGLQNLARIAKADHQQVYYLIKSQDKGVLEVPTYVTGWCWRTIIKSEVLDMNWEKTAGGQQEWRCFLEADKDPQVKIIPLNYTFHAFQKISVSRYLRTICRFKLFINILFLCKRK